jgi:uncharacterized membrane protein
MSMRNLFCVASGRVLAGLGVAPESISLYRDVSLAMPVIALVFFAGLPVFLVLAHEPLHYRLIMISTIAAVAALLLSLLSPNWPDILAAGFLFVAFRCAIGFLSSGNKGLAVVMLTFFVVALLLHRFNLVRKSV